MRVWKVALESLVKKRQGAHPNYICINRPKEEATTYQHLWMLGCQQHPPLAKDPLLHSSFTQQQGHNKELKVGK